MHRGSSKGTGRKRPVPESLPLSAFPPPLVRVELVVARGSRPGRPRALEVPSGTLVRSVLRQLGHAPEGSAVLEAGVPLPLDTPLVRSVRLTVVPTFSGG